VVLYNGLPEVRGKTVGAEGHVFFIKFQIILCLAWSFSFPSVHFLFHFSQQGKGNKCTEEKEN